MAVPTVFDEGDMVPDSGEEVHASAESDKS